MLSPVKLYNKLSFKTYKVYDIFTYCMLTSELEASQTFSAYTSPQDSLGIRRSAPEVFRVYNQTFRHLSVTLSQPSPLRDCVAIIFFDGAEKNGLLK